MVKTLIPWQPVSSSSTAVGTSLDHVAQTEITRSDTIDEEMMWESSKQVAHRATQHEIVIRLGTRASIYSLEL